MYCVSTAYIRNVLIPFQKNENAQVIFANAENGQSVRVSLEAANREKQEIAYCVEVRLNTFLFPSLTITQCPNTCPTLEGNRQSRNFASLLRLECLQATHRAGSILGGIDKTLVAAFRALRAHLCSLRATRGSRGPSDVM